MLAANDSECWHLRSLMTICVHIFSNSHWNRCREIFLDVVFVTRWSIGERSRSRCCVLTLVNAESLERIALTRIRSMKRVPVYATGKHVLMSKRKTHDTFQRRYKIIIMRREARRTSHACIPLRICLHIYIYNPRVLLRRR